MHISPAVFERWAKKRRGWSRGRPCLLMAGKTGKLTWASFPRRVNHWKFAFGKPQVWIWNGFQMVSLFLSPHWKCAISFQSISAILPGRESQYRFEVRYLSGPHNSHTIGVPITSKAICLHGAVRYQQGRDIQVAITHAGALPADVLHRFDVWCASRWVPPEKVSSDQIEKQGLDRKAAGWKTLTKRAMSAVLKTCI